jgi:hypothetical protein
MNAALSLFLLAASFYRLLIEARIYLWGYTARCCLENPSVEYNFAASYDGAPGFVSVVVLYSPYRRAYFTTPAEFRAPIFSMIASR